MADHVADVPKRFVPVPAGQQQDQSLKNDLSSIWKHLKDTQDHMAAAWAHVNGLADPPHIDASHNFRKVEKLGTGQYRLHFDTPMASDEYCCLVSSGETSPAIAPRIAGAYNYHRQYVDIAVWRVVGALAIDADHVSVAVFGERNPPLIK